MPVLLLLTFLFAAVGVFIFLVLMLMLIIGLNGFTNSAQVEPWLYGTALFLFVALNALSGFLLSLISRRQPLRWSWLVGSGWSALAFAAQLGLALVMWQLR